MASNTPAPRERLREIREKMQAPGRYRPSLEECELFIAEIDRLRQLNAECFSADSDEPKLLVSKRRFEELRAENAAIGKFLDPHYSEGGNVLWLVENYVKNLREELELSQASYRLLGKTERALRDSLIADLDQARVERDELRDLLMRLRESIVFNSKWDTEIGAALGAHAGEGTKGEKGIQAKWVTGTEEYVGKHVVHVGPGVCQTCGAKMRESTKEEEGK